MKIRNGFVSNSSSSSFVVKFKKSPKNVKELSEMLFGNLTKYNNPYDWDDIKSWSTLEIAKIVWKDMQYQDKNDIEVIIRAINSGSVVSENIESEPNYHDFKRNDDSFSMDWDAYIVARNRYAKKITKKFINTRLKKLNALENIKTDDDDDDDVYVFEYSDNDSTLGSAMEHGTLFDKLEHIKISKH